MYVVLDTSVIVEDFRLTTTTSRLLLEYLPLVEDTLIVPEIVILEAVNKFREGLDADLKKLTNAAEKVRAKVSEDTGFTLHNIDIHEQVDKYEAYLVKRLKQYKTQIPSFPAVTHQAVVERALARKRPFSADGRKGYRDALIWETIRELAKTTDEQITFITLNKNDFAADDGSLHGHLTTDIENDGHSSDKVKLSLKAHDFVSQHVIPALPPADQTIAKLIQKAGTGFDLEEALAISLHTPLTEYQMDNYGTAVEDVSICSVQDIIHYEFEHESKLSDDEVLLELNAVIDCEFNGFIFKSDYLVMHESEHERFYVWDPDWNDHYMAVSFSDVVKIWAYVTVDLLKAEFSMIEVLEVEYAEDEDHEA